MAEREGAERERERAGRVGGLRRLADVALIYLAVVERVRVTLASLAIPNFRTDHNLLRACNINVRSNWDKSHKVGRGRSSVYLAKGRTPGNPAGRPASKKPVSKGPNKPGAVMISSLATEVPPCGRPVTMITGPGDTGGGKNI